MNTQINITENGTTILATAGKYCDRNIAVNTYAVYEVGKKAEYDTFWDEYQKRGQSTNYRYSFAGDGWTDKTFKPKYDITPINATYMFGYSKVTDVKACLESCGVTLDLSKATNTGTLFGYCYYLTTLPKIDLSSTTSNSSTFHSSSKLETIEEVAVSENTPFLSSFNNCTALENMIVTGTIAKNGFNVQWSTNLSHDSLMSIINCLADKSGDTSGTQWKITLGETNLEKLTLAEKAIMDNKGWLYQ